MSVCAVVSSLCMSDLHVKISCILGVFIFLCKFLCLCVCFFEVGDKFCDFLYMYVFVCICECVCASENV